MTMAARWRALLAAAAWTACAASLAGVLLGGVHLAVEVPARENNCTMTYMWPNYYPVPMVNRSRLAFKYRLLQFAHRELDEAERAQRPPKVVLFVPGSAGSEDQVRSIGKEIMDTLQARGQPRTAIAVYTVDFADEPSAISSLFLEDQAEFLKDALRAIGEAHDQPEVVLFGHSMGGVVARMVMAAADQDDPLLLRVPTRGLRPEQASETEASDVVLDGGAIETETSDGAMESVASDVAAETEATDIAMDNSVASDGATDSDLAAETEATDVAMNDTASDTVMDAEAGESSENIEAADSAEDADTLGTDEVEIADDIDAADAEDAASVEEEAAVVEQEAAVIFSALFTLSSPHRAPVVGADGMMWQLYNELSGHHDDARVYVSVAGGYRDVLVPSALAQLDKSQYKQSASALTSVLPDVGLSTDHLAILWCNEVVKRLAGHVVDALDGRATLLLSSPGFKSKRIPRAGYAKNEVELFAPRGGSLGNFFADIMARKFAICVLPGLFASMLFMVLALAGAPVRELAVYVALVASAGAAMVDISDPRPLDWRVMAVAASSGAGLGGLVLLTAQIFLRWSKMLVGWAPQVLLAGILTAKIYYGSGWLPVGGEWLAVALLWLIGYTALLILANLGSARELYKFEGMINAQHLQVLFSLAYAPAVCVSAFAAVYCGLLLFRPELGFGDHFPVETLQGSLGVYHAVLDETLPEEVVLSESLRVPGEGRMTSSAVVLIVSTFAMLLPVTVHLYSLLFFPAYAAPEKVLDSQYKYVRVPTSPPPDDAEASFEGQFDFATGAEGDDKAQGAESSASQEHEEDVNVEASKPRGKKKKKKKAKQGNKAADSTTAQSGSLVAGAEHPDGAVEFDDSEYIRESSFRIVKFSDGDAVQVDDLRDAGSPAQLSPDAVPLIETQGSTSADGSKLVCELHQRVRSAVHVFPDAIGFRAVLGGAASAALLLGPAHIFVLQILAAAVAVSCLAMRWEGGASERVERTLVPRAAAAAAKQK